MGQTLFFHETCRSSCWVLFTKAGLVRSYATLKVLSWTFTWQGEFRARKSKFHFSHRHAGRIKRDTYRLTLRLVCGFG